MLSSITVILLLCYYYTVCIPMSTHSFRFFRKHLFGHLCTIIVKSSMANAFLSLKIGGEHLFSGAL